MPVKTNPRTASASSGAAMIGMSRRNNATAQNIRGVVIHVLYGLSKVGSLILKITRPRTVRKKNAQDATTVKLMRERNPPPRSMKAIVMLACRSMAFRGVFLVGCSRPNRAGKYPSLPAT